MACARRPIHGGQALFPTLSNVCAWIHMAAEPWTCSCLFTCCSATFMMMYTVTFVRNAMCHCVQRLLVPMLTSSTLSRLSHTPPGPKKCEPCFLNDVQLRASPCDLLDGTRQHTACSVIDHRVKDGASRRPTQSCLVAGTAISNTSHVR